MTGGPRVEARADHCEGCGRTEARAGKAFRVYKGHWYCGACYKRLFKRALCPGCSDFARLYSRDADAVCLSCEKNRPCVRCGKEEYKIGKLTTYGPVCASCAPHFREPKPCGYCGELSSRLTRVKARGIDVPVCGKCAGAHKRPCPACRFPRELLDAPNGRQLCRKCLEGGEMDCPVCGDAMPAGRGSKCVRCALRQTLHGRVAFNQAAFKQPEMAQTFSEFAAWLESETGVERAVHLIGKFVPFFMTMEQEWGMVPTYPVLLAYFGAEGLRRVRLPMRWLSVAKDVTADTVQRKEHSEVRRIDDLLGTFVKGSVANATLQGYAAWLNERRARGRTSLRSVRLALRPAVSLLQAIDPLGNLLPQQAQVNLYLREKPGQAAAVTGFVLFLNRTQGAELAVVVDQQATQELRRKRLEKRMLEMMRSPEEGLEFERAWMRAALLYFHGVSASKKVLAQQSWLYTESGQNVVVRGVSYWLPAPWRSVGESTGPDAPLS